MRTENAHAGETILVAKSERSWARLVPLEEPQSSRQSGVLRGRLQLPLLCGLVIQISRCT